MNISNPVASEVTGVDFRFFSTEEIQRVSVKQIVNPVTFEDAIPGKIPVAVAGGLYDPALGASAALRQRCSTCHLDYKYCPGHVGHITLPVPVYHPLFFDQMLRLLRSTCVYCFRFRVARAEVNRFVCKLKLIQHGLLVEAHELDDIHFETPKQEKDDADTTATVAGGGDEEEKEKDVGGGGYDEELEAFFAKRRKLVDGAIRKQRKEGSGLGKRKVMSVAEERRSVVKEFLGSLLRPRKCNNCQAISPTFRKDGFSKIFELPLNVKNRSQNAQRGLRRRNTALDRKNTPNGTQKVDPDAMEVDEASADSGEDSEEEVKIQEAQDRKGAAGRLLPSIEVLNTLIRLFENEKDIVQLLYQPRAAISKSSGKVVTPHMFFLHAIAVPPTKFRPPQAAGGEISESASNRQLVKVLQGCLTIRDLNDKYNDPGATSEDKVRTVGRLMQAFVTLQDDVSTFLDSSKSSLTGAALRNLDDGIKQKLEKKEGLFRMNMMGKRVNFAARSVISPDPNIETREIGVPPVFASKLTYPEPVTEVNHTWLMGLVVNGPDKWPGAVAIEMENGSVQRLPGDKIPTGRQKRVHLSKTLLTPDALSTSDSRPKKVHRHLHDGDVVLMNRQPTLHKPSMMGHIAKVLPGERTIRMHYANCNTYNADFDGDEMNMHLPQNEVAKAEAREIANTDSQYLVPTSGKPLRGLIQDHLVMGVWLTNRDTMFTRDEYQQLLYSCLLPEHNSLFRTAGKSNRIVTLPPAIFKPRALWTGKQLITTILENIRPKWFSGLTLYSRSKTPGDSWYPGCEEGSIIVHDGYFVSGILDKSQLGPTEFGLIHSVYEVYGSTIAGSLLSIMGRLLTKFLHMRAHTCGMDDLLLTPEGDERRRRVLVGSKQVGKDLSVEYVGLKEGKDISSAELASRLEEVLRDENKSRTLDLKANAQTKNFTSRVITECLPSGLQKHFPRNNFQAMTVSGAKGSDVNASQISCLLGQQVLEGRRVPVMISGKTLPCFKPFETDVRAGGYVTDRFLTGVRPQEYFFHCMAGREGLIDTAVKTSRSGYLQRCLIKGMEGIRVHYDNTVRDSDGSLVQFLYGEDSLDVSKQKHLRQFKFLAQNVESIVRMLADDRVAENLGPRLMMLSEKLNFGLAAEHLKKSMKRYIKKGDLGASEVTISQFSPSRYVGSVSESFAAAREKYMRDNPHKLIVGSKHRKTLVGDEMSRGLDKAEFRNLMDLKYLRSVVDPGEAVGIIAGQSIGEPSTQMTLNTFHLAGHATKNVTLGIPRLREIVMTASASIATPTMTLTLQPGITDREADTFAKRCSKLMLSEIIDEVTVTENLTKASKKYLIRLNLYPSADYQEEYSITKRQVLNCLKMRFLLALESAVNKALNPGKKKFVERIGRVDAMPDVGESSGTIEEAPRVSKASEDAEEPADDANSDDDEDDEDATNAKKRSRKSEAVSYDNPDDEEEEISRRARVDDDDSESESDGADDGRKSDEDPITQEPPAGKGKRSAALTPGKGGTKGNSAVHGPPSENISKFEFDTGSGEWCEVQLEYPPEAPKVLMLGIVEKVCRETVIHQLKSVGSVVKVPASEMSKDDQAAGKRKLAVEGVSFASFWDEQDTIDPNTLETNDIAAFLRVYGVEAARSNIIKEMNAVFAGHGISVDTRHLNLIADIMTRNGGFTPFSRQGLKTSVSPFLKMSFETTCNFLKEAVAEGDFDDLESPSSRIVVGKVSGVGSGCFDVLVGGLRGG